MKTANVPITISADTSKFLIYIQCIQNTLEMIETTETLLNDALQVNDLSGEEIDELQNTISEVSYKCQLIVNRRT